MIKKASKVWNPILSAKDEKRAEKFLSFLHDQTAPFEEMRTYYECAILEVTTKFRVLDKQLSLKYDENPIEEIKSRVKDNESLARKVIRKGIPWDPAEIEKNIDDIAGVRIICSFQEDIYRLEESFLKQDDVTLIERKDYIKEPKESGYRSLHLIVSVPIFLENEKRDVKVEVQFRTLAMDFWASLEHKLRYKKNLSEEELEVLSNELDECAEQSHALDLRMERVRKSIRNGIVDIK
ncbi:GTP pyrophosphokinase [Butyrivibrio sp. INlla16]|uniref:GTP pyrophosphokinase n=1 Tax=Butyrivibrio sp. INlla16 TaxID=1520807 RepID=UPI000B84A3D3